MKYMMLVYEGENCFAEGEREQCLADSIQLCHDLHAEKKYINAAPLQPVSTATSIRVRNNKRLVTDGPFAETTEQLGGFYLIEAKDLDEAISIAARIPGARKGTIEIRPIVELTNLPKTN